MSKVSHLTSVHSRTDTRIFLKECISLAKHGYDVSLLVADGKGDDKKSGVAIYDVGASKGRLDRMRHAPSRLLKKALQLDADVYHLHDPELLLIGLKLKKRGKVVIMLSFPPRPISATNSLLWAYVQWISTTIHCWGNCRQAQSIGPRRKCKCCMWVVWDAYEAFMKWCRPWHTPAPTSSSHSGAILRKPALKSW